MIFGTTFILPEVEAGSAPLQIKKFETDVQNTVHRIGDLNQKILFDSLSLQGTNGPIEVQVRLAEINLRHSLTVPSLVVLAGDLWFYPHNQRPYQRNIQYDEIFDNRDLKQPYRCRCWSRKRQGWLPTSPYCAHDQ